MIHTSIVNACVRINGSTSIYTKCGPSAIFSLIQWLSQALGLRKRNYLQAQFLKIVAGMLQARIYQF